MTYWFHMDEGVMQIADGFRDHSLQALQWRTPGGHDVAMTIQRQDVLEEATGIDVLVDRSVDEYTRGLAGFALDERRSLDDVAFPARLLRFRWLGDEGVVCQVQGFARIGQRLLVQTVTASTAIADEAERLVVTALTTLRLRER